jgi:hypothetical protein
MGSRIVTTLSATSFQQQQLTRTEPQQSSNWLQQVKVKTKVKVTLQATVLVSSTHLGPRPDSWRVVDVGRPLWPEDRSVAYNCCWSSPAQSFSGPSSTGLITMFYCLRFETPPNWRARFPYLYALGTGWPSYTSRQWVPFSSPPTTRRATVELFEPASKRGWLQRLTGPAYNISARTA